MIALHRAALLDAGPAPTELAANVPLTSGRGRLFACLPYTADGKISVTGLSGAWHARLLRDGRALPSATTSGTWTCAVPDDVRDPLGDVVELEHAR